MGNAPQPLDESFELEAFCCGHDQLDRWLKQRALTNEASGATRTFVIASRKRVVGYYSLSVGSATHILAPGRIRRNMPDPIPVAILARLAIDQEWQGRKLGKALMQDAILRILAASDSLGIRAIMIHAVSVEARQFYEHFGFSPSPIEPLTLMATLTDLRRSVSQ